MRLEIKATFFHFVLLVVFMPYLTIEVEDSWIRTSRAATAFVKRLHDRRMFSSVAERVANLAYRMTQGLFASISAAPDPLQQFTPGN